MVHGVFRKRVLNEEEKAQTQSMFCFRKTAWMVFEHFKISATDGAVLPISDLLKVELKGDNMQPFDTKWDETVIVMQKQADEELLEIFARHLL